MKLEGIHTPVITPFNDDYSIDDKALATVIEYQVASGVDGIIISGTTGESYALNAEERTHCLRLAKDAIHGQVALIAGIGATRTEDVIDLGVAAREVGVDAILLPAPAYAVPSDKELAQHCLAVDQAVNLPIILYNYPGRTGAMMGPSFLNDVGGNKNFCAIKETSGDINRMHLLARDYSDLQLSCGWDDQALEFFAWGARSWVAAGANFLPKEHIALYESCVIHNDFATGRRIMSAMLPLFRLLDEGGKFIQCVKYGCELQGLRAGTVRKPLAPLTEELEQEMTVICQTLKASIGEIQVDREEYCDSIVNDKKTQSAP